MFSHSCEYFDLSAIKVNVAVTKNIVGEEDQMRSFGSSKVMKAWSASL